MESSAELTRVTQEERVLGLIRGWVAQGRYRPGTRLPSERELAVELDVNRKAVHAALDRLERDGLVVSVSPRIRAVAHAVPEQIVSMARSVVVLTKVTEERHAAQTDGGTHSVAFTGICESIQRAGLNPMTVAPARLDGAMVRQLIGHRPRGILALADALCVDRTLRPLRQLVEAGIPVAAYADVLPEAALHGARFDRVTSDQAGGARQLTEYLIARGCTRILRLWDIEDALEPRPEWLIMRDRGVVEACKAAQIKKPRTANVARFASGPNVSRARFDQLTRMVLGFLYEHLTGPDPVDGILTLSDHNYYYAAAACRMLGREPQKDVLIAGYDNTWPTFAERRFESSVPVATVDKNMAGIGRALVETLTGRIEGTLPKAAHTVAVPQKLIALDEE